MSRPALVCEWLDIRRFLGVRRAQDALSLTAEMLSPGITLVVGPNASGKTTTALALQTLLWPESAGKPPPSLAGGFRVGDVRWQIDLEAGHVTRQPDSGWAQLGVAPATARPRWRPGSTI